MYSEIEHISFSTMSNSELFLIKENPEEVSKFEIEKRPKLKFQSHCNQEEEEGHESRKEADPLLSSGENNKLKVQQEKEEEEDGFRTPTSLDNRIPEARQCPVAPRKPKQSLKRKVPQSLCSCRNPLDLSKEVELLLFQTQHSPLSNSLRSTKKVRREDPK